MAGQHLDFRGPKPSPVITRLFYWLMPAISRYVLGGFQVSFRSTDLERLQTLKGEHLLLLPNHPAPEDPVVLFALSKALQEPFYYVGAREMFDWEHGLRGWFLQRLGVYSVVRGKTDRQSFETSIELLKAGQHPLVIFIEGEMSSENDTLMPFEPGVIQLAFIAQDKLPESVSVTLMPVSIRYRLKDRNPKPLLSSIRQLERRLGLPGVENQTVCKRIQHIFERVVELQEAKLQLSLPPGATWDERLMAIKEHIVGKMELFLELKPPPDMTFLERIRNVRNQMDEWVYSHPELESPSIYESALSEHQRQLFETFYRDLERLKNLLTLHTAYITEESPPEHYFEVLRCLELEVLGKMKLTCPRMALVKLGEPVRLLEHMQAYHQHRKQTVQSIVQTLEREMKSLILKQSF
jgi:1-acyl-sn-glycerol-3-phosphate acyltransferase